MLGVTLADLDKRLAAMVKAAKDPRRPVEERRLARKVIDGYLDERLKVMERECSPSS